MKLICFKTQLATCLMALAGLIALQSCREKPQETWLKVVFDDKAINGEMWNLDYDYWGRLCKYGDSKINYSGNSINVDTLKWNALNEKMHTLTFVRSRGIIQYSKAYCTIEHDSLQVEALKESNYVWKEDSLFINSKYFKVNDKSLLKSVFSCYVYDKQKRLTESIIRHYDNHDIEASACHSYYDYHNPPYYIANLNLTAFIADRDGLDIFLLFLMQMDQETDKYRAVPTKVRHCVNHGKYMFEAEGLYRMKNETLFHLEFISTDVKLKNRLDFTYYNEDVIRTGRIKRIGLPL